MNISIIILLMRRKSERWPGPSDPNSVARAMQVAANQHEFERELDVITRSWGEGPDLTVNQPQLKPEGLANTEAVKTAVAVDLGKAATEQIASVVLPSPLSPKRRLRFGKGLVASLELSIQIERS